jgi:hypothetical protein
MRRIRCRLSSSRDLFTGATGRVYGRSSLECNTRRQEESHEQHRFDVGGSDPLGRSHLLGRSHPLSSAFRGLSGRINRCGRAAPSLSEMRHRMAS